MALEMGAIRLFQGAIYNTRVQRKTSVSSYI